MIYFKNQNNEVYAYSEEQIQKTIELTEIESRLPESRGELDSVPPIVYEMRDNIQNFHKMTEDEVELYTNPPKTHEQYIIEAELQKSHLLSLATEKIAPLQDAVDLGEATEEEFMQLKSWKKFRVLVNRVDTSLATDIEWPEMPPNVIR